MGVDPSEIDAPASRSLTDVKDDCAPISVRLQKAIRAKFEAKELAEKRARERARRSRSEKAGGEEEEDEAAKARRLEEEAKEKEQKEEEEKKKKIDGENSNPVKTLSASEWGGEISKGWCLVLTLTGYVCVCVCWTCT